MHEEKNDSTKRRNREIKKIIGDLKTSLLVVI